MITSKVMTEQAKEIRDRLRIFSCTDQLDIVGAVAASLVVELSRLERAASMYSFLSSAFFMAHRIDAARLAFEKEEKCPKT